MSDFGLCLEKPCQKKPVGRGLCHTHYRLWQLSRNIPCKVDGCDTPAITRSMCEKHYLRYKRHGDPGSVSRHLANSPEESFQIRTIWENDCLVWQGSTNSWGYGEIWIGDRTITAHCYAWTRSKGPIPDGMLVDHKCFNRACCNIDHLRLATHQENMMNKPGPRRDNKSSGVRNVYKSGNRWSVKVGLNRKRYSFGSYETIEEAREVAEQARHKLFGEFAGRG